MRVALVAIGFLIAGTAPTPANAEKLSTTDQFFVDDAARVNLAAIQLGELGVKKGSTPDIRSLAQTLLDEHKKLGDRLQAISTREGFPLPAEPNADQKATRDRLAGLSGPEFDQAFLDELKNAHLRAILIFREESQNGQDPQLKSLAESTLPSLQQHQQLVNRQSGKL
jgi:putative membrane protein